MNLIDRLELLLELVAQLQIHYDPDKEICQENEVLIGFGQQEDGKYCFDHLATEYDSTTELIYYLNDEDLPLHN